jgi:hypothetical protein
MISRWAGPVIAITFLTSMITAGDGIAPIGVLLVVLPLAISPYALVGWIPVFLLLVATVLSNRTALMAVRTGSGISFCAWMWLLVHAEWGMTILLSIHYLAAMFYFLIYRPVVYGTEEPD